MEQDLIIGINPILEKLKASPEDISEILLARGPRRPEPSRRDGPRVRRVAADRHEPLRDRALDALR